MDWFAKPDASASKWDHAEKDWKEALRRVQGNELAALGVLVALAVDRLEDVKQMVAQLERGPSA